MVSVIIPVYNREKYIEECVQSVQKQTYQNYEIVFVDDGSTDDSLNICRMLAKKNPKIQVLESTHAGVSAARNIALEAAQGEYVFFLDSDDMIHPQLLEALVNGLKSTDAAIAGTQVMSVLEKYWDKAYSHIEEDCGPGEWSYLSFEETMKAVFGGEKNPLSMIGGVMMRRDLIGNTRFCEELYIGEDFYFIYENLIKGVSTVFLKQIWYYGRHHADNSSWDLGYTGFMNRLLRRELVWKSEEAMGRPQYADIVKSQAFGLYEYIAFRKKLPKKEKRQIKNVMRTYGKILFPALNQGDKLRYVLYIWVPGGEWIWRILFRTFRPLIRKIRHIKK